MARIYSVAFISAVLDGVTPTVDFTCPPGFVAILRSVDAYSTGIVLPQNISMVEIPSGTKFWVATATPPPLAQAHNWRGRQVFEAGVGFQIVAEEGTWGVRASGYLLGA